MTIINRLTGEEATDREIKLIHRRALQILSSPYSSPELIAWAIEIGPPGCEDVYWESVRERRQRQRKEERDRQPRS